MGDQLISSVVTVMTAIVGLAIIATLVSKNANTAGVITAGSNGFSSSLTAALAPVDGNSGFGGSNMSTGFMS
jgi:hypothetical protein